MCPMPSLPTTDRSSGGRLVTDDGRELPLREASLEGRARGGLARIELLQRFANPHAEPLRVHYALPLPPGGIVAGYSLTVGERTIRGTIERREEARLEFEQALADGRLASLLEQERTSLFTQEVGNVPPGAEVVVRIAVDQKLDWIAGGEWEWRFPTVVAPRYLGSDGRVPDAARIEIDVIERGSGARAEFSLAIEDEIPEAGLPSSPSHTISWKRESGIGSGKVTLSGERAALDRDVVIRWPAAGMETGATIRTARPAPDRPRGESAYGLLTVVPPAAPARAVARDLVLLLDTSGSMSGMPLDRARRVALELVAHLDEGDRLEMIAFSSAPVRWKRSPVPANERARADASKWLEALQAGGGTEMGGAVVEALAPIREDSHRQVVLVTDGEIGFEQEVCTAVRDRLPDGSRLHTVGVGSAVNRTLTRGAARAGRGVEIVAGLDEEPAAVAARVAKALERPVLVDVAVTGSAVLACAPERVPDVMAGSPLLLSLALRPEGGELFVRGRAPEGPWERRLSVPSVERGAGDPAVVLHYARELVEDLEGALASRDSIGSRTVQAGIERAGLDFGIATRHTSWVAVSEETSVDPTDPSRSVRMPQALPYGMSIEGLGLRQPMSAARRGVAVHGRTAFHRASSGQRIREFGAEFMESLGLSSVRDELLAPDEPDMAPERIPGFLGRWIKTLFPARWILLFDATDGDLDWHPGARAVIELEDGSTLEAVVDLDRSTRRGNVRAGLTVRVVMRIDSATARRARIVRLDGPAGPVVVRL